MDFARLLKLVTRPREYWDASVTDPGEFSRMLMPEMLILAAVPAASWFLGFVLGSFGLAVRFGMVGRLLFGAVFTVVLSYAMYVGCWVLFAIIIDAFARPFQAQKDFGQALKLAKGAIVPMYAGSVLYLTTVQWLGLLGMLGGLGCGFYVLSLGLPVMNGTESRKALGYAGATSGIMAMVLMTLFAITSCSAGCMLVSGITRLSAF